MAVPSCARSGKPDLHTQLKELHEISIENDVLVHVLPKIFTFLWPKVTFSPRFMTISPPFPSVFHVEDAEAETRKLEEELEAALRRVGGPVLAAETADTCRF